METFLSSMEMLQIGQQCARSSWTVKSEETIGSSLPSTRVDACFISPPYFHIAPHHNLFFHLLRLKLSLLVILFLFFIFFLSFFIFVFCLALHEQIIKASLLQGGLGRKNLPEVIWNGLWNLQTVTGKAGIVFCSRKTRYSFPFQIPVT